MFALAGAPELEASFSIISSPIEERIVVIDTEPTKLATNAATALSFSRFHAPHLHLQSVFGDDWFALKAEAFARFFGTPSFLITQTVIVAVWILVNILGL